MGGRAAGQRNYITYIWTLEGWLYLAVILDLHSRHVVGWAVSDRMKKDLAIRALETAARLRQRDCQDFRVRRGIMGNKETQYATTERTLDTERHPRPT